MQITVLGRWGGRNYSPSNNALRVEDTFQQILAVGITRDTHRGRSITKSTYCSVCIKKLIPILSVLARTGLI